MKNDNIIKELALSYAMELETVQNYIAASVNLEGIRESLRPSRSRDRYNGLEDT